VLCYGDGDTASREGEGPLPRSISSWPLNIPQVKDYGGWSNPGVLHVLAAVRPSFLRRPIPVIFNRVPVARLVRGVTSV
jgi:hypothetical protein